MFRMYMPCNDGTILNLVSNVMTIHLNMSCSLARERLDWLQCARQSCCHNTTKPVCDAKVLSHSIGIEAMLIHSMLPSLCDT